MAEKRPSRYTRDSTESDERFRKQMERDEKFRAGLLDTYLGAFIAIALFAALGVAGFWAALLLL